MVTFVLLYRDGDILRYAYYPNDHQNKRPGIIEINLKTEMIEIIDMAEEDVVTKHSVEEQNMLRDGVNEMRKENGEPELTEEEWPTATEVMEKYFFGDHAISKIIYSIYRKGEIPKKGMSMWY